MRRSPRRARTVPGAAGTTALGISLLFGVAAGPAAAHDQPAEFAGFKRMQETPVRTTVTPADWARLSRSAVPFGPRPLRGVDTEMIAKARAGDWVAVVEMATKGVADPSATDATGINILSLAVRAGQDEAVRELVRHGADLDRPGDDGFTPLGVAAFTGQSFLVRWLLKAGADPLALSANGQTPLHLAALAGRLTTIEVLLERRVDLTLLNGRRETAFDLATRAGQDLAAQRLVAAGADTPRNRPR